jgi:hypothetical protein
MIHPKRTQILKPVVQPFSKGFALIPQPLLPYMGEGEPEFQSPLPDLGEGFRVRVWALVSPTPQ